MWTARYQSTSSFPAMRPSSRGLRGLLPLPADRQVQTVPKQEVPRAPVFRKTPQLEERRGWLEAAAETTRPLLGARPNAPPTRLSHHPTGPVNSGTSPPGKSPAHPRGSIRDVDL